MKMGDLEKDWKQQKELYKWQILVWHFGYPSHLILDLTAGALESPDKTSWGRMHTSLFPQMR